MHPIYENNKSSISEEKIGVIKLKLPENVKGDVNLRDTLKISSWFEKNIYSISGKAKIIKLKHLEISIGMLN